MIEFAPLFVPWRRRLQTLGVMWYIFSFMFAALTCLFLYIYLTLFTRLWPLTLAYTVFYFYDWKTPEEGGRPIRFIRDLRVWKWMMDYFPIFAHKTVELDSTKTYILACHPHGVLCPSTFLTILMAGNLMEELYPKFHTRLSMLNFWFRVPFFREYIMSGALTMVTKTALQNMLDKFQSGFLLAIIPGGAPEALEANPGDCRIIINDRMGYIKLAIKNGVPLIPCFAFGEHACWTQRSNPKGSRLRNIQDKLIDLFGMSLPIMETRGIFQYTTGLIPRRGALHFWVGEPIEVAKNPNPSKEELENLRDLYKIKLRELFDEHKSKYLKPGTKLIYL